MPKAKDPKLARAGVSGYNKPKRTPSHPTRSEEHTSELQSHSDLVCRLLLEKNKNIYIISTILDVKSMQEQRFVRDKNTEIN